jgi:choline-glycine betaine transporter
MARVRCLKDVPEEVREMASRIRHIVQPLLGWTFVLVVIAALAVTLFFATRPMVEVTGRINVQQAH